MKPTNSRTRSRTNLTRLLFFFNEERWWFYEKTKERKRFTCVRRVGRTRLVTNRSNFRPLWRPAAISYFGLNASFAVFGASLDMILSEKKSKFQIFTLSLCTNKLNDEEISGFVVQRIFSGSLVIYFVFNRSNEKRIFRRKKLFDWNGFFFEILKKIFSRANWWLACKRVVMTIDESSVKQKTEIRGQRCSSKTKMKNFKIFLNK